MPAPLSGRRILVCEDEAIIAMDLDGLLRDAGARVTGPAFTLRAACRLAEETPFDAAVVDLWLGPEPAWPLVDLLTGQGVPLLVVTGKPVDWVLAQRPGLAVVEKPYVGADLVRRLVASLAANAAPANVAPVLAASAAAPVPRA